MTEQHSPLPWRVERFLKTNRYEIIDINNNTVCILAGKKTAEHFVRAVNSYDRMRDLLVLILGGYKPTETEIKAALEE